MYHPSQHRAAARAGRIPHNPFHHAVKMKTVSAREPRRVRVLLGGTLHRCFHADGAHRLSRLALCARTQLLEHGRAGLPWRWLLTARLWFHAHPF